MPSYETLCILHPELPEARMKELTAWMQKILEGSNGTVSRVDEWGLRDLAYHIKKQRRGYYVRLEYDAPAAALRELERNLRINEHILRFLSVARTPSAAVPQPTPPPSAPTPVSPVETTGGEQ
jgi:small subunit ribosomal protein S6